MHHKASVGIYQRELKYDDNSSCPLIPDVVFETAKKVLETKGHEIVKTKDGFFLVSYSETGPFTDISSNEWVPVQVVRLKQWTTGGIKNEEMKNYDPSWEPKQKPASSATHSVI